MSVAGNCNGWHGLLSPGAQISNHFSNTSYRPVKRCASTTIFLFLLFLFFIILRIGTFIYWTDISVIADAEGPLHETFFSTKSPMMSPNKIEFPLNCSDDYLRQTCPANYPSTVIPSKLSATGCPEYFRWIHEDLKPWKSTGITRDMVERSKDHAHFRLVIIKGKMYVEKNHQNKPYQTRDLSTIWGILQLLRLYPGKVPDLELMFSVEDQPVTEKRHYQGPNATSPPTMFSYCRHDETLDIVFPDSTFWGWPELNIKPWKSVLNNIKEGNKKIRWKDRVPYAQWKGNSKVSLARMDLMKCNVSDTHDWNARLYDVQGWNKEKKQGFNNSKLEDQCTHRYKIYIQGWSWSSSNKYILACDSVTLYISNRYDDFFSRSLVPLQHYWPIRKKNKCIDIKFAVEWGNNHTNEAQAIGEAGSKFTQEELNMEYVYDYMFHLLSEYAKLLKFKPSIPQGAEEVCAETVACNLKGVLKEIMVESIVNSPSDTLPCAMPPPYDPHALQAFLERKKSITRQVGERVINIGSI